MCCLFAMAEAQATAYCAVVWWITLQTPLQESEGRAGLMPYGHGTGGNLNFPMIQEKINQVQLYLYSLLRSPYVRIYHKIF